MDELQPGDVLQKEWEYNGYDDSDFYAILWNPETGWRRIETGSTRYPGGIEVGHLPKTFVSEADRAKAKASLKAMLLAQVLGSPATRQVGELARILKDGKCKDIEMVTDSCRRCQGTGAWVNPRIPEDRRECFGCEGSGNRTSFVSVPGMVGYVAGTVGTVAHVVSYRVVSWKSPNSFYVLNSPEGLRRVPSSRVGMTTEEAEALAEQNAERLNAYPLFRTAGFSMV